MAADDLTTKAKVKEALNIPSAHTNRDAQIDSAIEYVTARIKTWCRRSHLYAASPATITETRDGGGIEIIYTREFPVLTLTSVHDDTDRDFSGTALVNGTDFVYDADIGKFERIDNTGGDILKGQTPGIWAKGQRNVQFIYTAGYTTRPADLEMAAIFWVTEFLNTVGMAGLASFSKGPLTDTAALHAIPPQVKQMLSKYKSTTREA